MLMLTHGRELTREQMRPIPTPPPSATWKPVGHFEAVQTLVKCAEARGLRVACEQYSLMNGRKTFVAGTPEKMSGARLYGSIDFAPSPALPLPFGCRPSAGIRNSHDRSFALAILSGTRVIVCQNGVLSAEHTVARRHTAGLDLRSSVNAALDAFVSSIRVFGERYERMKGLSLGREKARSLLVDLAEAGAIGQSEILRVAHEFERPRFLEFERQSSWSLYNAVTEILKRHSAPTQVKNFRALNTVFDSLLN